MRLSKTLIRKRTLSTASKEFTSFSDDKEEHSLLTEQQSPTKGPTLFVVSSNDVAMMMCKRNGIFCCVKGEMSYREIPDGTLVEMLEPETREDSNAMHSFVDVRIKRSVRRDLNDCQGIMRRSWLQPILEFTSADKREEDLDRTCEYDKSNSSGDGNRSRSRWRWPRMSSMASFGSSKHFFVVHESEDEEYEQEKLCEREDATQIKDVDPILGEFERALEGFHAETDDQNRSPQSEKDDIVASNSLEGCDSKQVVDERSCGRQLSDVVRLVQDGQHRLLGKADILMIADELEARLPLRLPYHLLEYASITPESLLISFLFGDRKHYPVSMLPSTRWVLESRHTEDALLVHERNTAKQHTTIFPKLLVARKLEFRLQDGHIESIRPGGLLLKGILNINVGLRTKFCLGRIDVDEYGRTCLQTDSNGMPLVKDKHYMPKKFDEWLVLSAFRKKFWIGMS